VKKLLPHNEIMNSLVLFTYASLFVVLESAIVEESIQTDACTSSQALSHINERLNKPFGPGSIAMLELAKNHSIRMSKKRKIFRPSIASINAEGGLPCKTFLNGAFIGYTRTTCAEMWSRKQHSKGIFSSVRIRKHLHAVVGEHRDRNGGAWCTVLFGIRTAFSNEGKCARVECKPMRVLEIRIGTSTRNTE